MSFENNHILKISDSTIREDLKLLVLKTVEEKTIIEENVIKLLKTNNYDEITNLWRSKNCLLKLSEPLIFYFDDFLRDGIEVEYHHMICRVYTMLNDESKIKINKIIDDKNITDNYIIERINIMKQYGKYN